MKYKVKPWIDDTWEVYEEYDEGEYNNLESPTPVYSGSLSDCESWIRLKEGGYL